MAELLERGYEATTMLGIARRAGASKETLYSWFTSKEGLFAALIARNAERTAHDVAAGMASDDPARAVLTRFAENVQALLLGQGAVAINRFAMQSPELSAILLEYGRVQTGALVERYLQKLMEEGMISTIDPAEAFRLLYGLIIEDRQIRVLLGDEPPTAESISRHAVVAVDRFLLLLRA
jgi:AcrR family transcriptional regulator